MTRHLTSGLDRSACLGLLGTRSWGRLVYTRRALPEVLPASYHLEGERVLIRLAHSEAATASRDAVVAFEVDDFDAAFRSGWTVTIVGLAREVTPSGEREWLAGQDIPPWAGVSEDHVLAMTAGRMSGHRLTPDEPSPAGSRAALT